MVITIIFVVCMVLFFSLGVERGKKVALIQVSQSLAAASRTPELVKPEPAEKPVGRISVKHEVKPVRPKPKAADDKREVLEIKIDEDLKYTIQVASFKKEINANKEAKTLETKGFETFVMPKGSYSIVCVGRFAEKNDARLHAKKLKGKYGDYLIRRL